MPADIDKTRVACAAALKLVKQKAIESAPIPPIHNIERWWGPAALEFLRLLRNAIAAVSADNSAERTLLMVAFCRSLISLSNAAFNHQSMSFKQDAQTKIDFDIDMASVFSEDVRFVLEGASENPTGKGLVVLGDSRNPAGAVDGPFDLVVTSPPYANRMSYIRELRPYTHIPHPPHSRR